MDRDLAQQPAAEGAAPEPASVRSARRRAWMGLALGPLLALVVYLAIPAGSPAAQASPAESLAESATASPAGLPQAGRVVAAVGTLMATWWITEALPIAVTALLPIPLFPLLTGGVISVRSAAASYAHEMIFLFFGGFVLALAIQHTGLHRRIALRTILLVGTRPPMLVAGFMLASAFLSMWVSNTATVVLMLPIATSVIELVRREVANSSELASLAAPHQPFHFAICLLLGTAYASSIGGIGTLIGTPPNALLAAYVARHHEIEISFVRWMGVGVPLVLVFLPVTWLLLTRLVFPIRLPRIPGGQRLIRGELEALGPISHAERLVLAVFVVTAAAWITRPLLVKFQLPGGLRPLEGLTDTGIAILTAVVLFALPVDVGRGRFVLSWKQMGDLPWGILLLFGGGLSLAAAADATKLAEFIGHGVSGLHELPIAVLVLMVTATIVFLTELTSNTATTATFLPILGAAAIGLDVSPLLLVVPAAIGASCAFMMPVATPPNAIVFGSGEITVPQMCKAGLWLNLIGITLIMVLMYFIVLPMLQIQT